MFLFCVIQCALNTDLSEKFVVFAAQSPNTTVTYELPSDNNDVWLLSVRNNYGAGAVVVLNQASASSKIVFTDIKRDSQYFTFGQTTPSSSKKFTMTTGAVNATAYLVKLS